MRFHESFYITQCCDLIVARVHGCQREVFAGSDSLLTFEFTMAIEMHLLT